MKPGRKRIIARNQLSSPATVIWLREQFLRSAHIISFNLIRLRTQLWVTEIQMNMKSSVCRLCKQSTQVKSIQCKHIQDTHLIVQPVTSHLAFVLNQCNAHFFTCGYFEMAVASSLVAALANNHGTNAATKRIIPPLCPIPSHALVSFPPPSILSFALPSCSLPFLLRSSTHPKRLGRNISKWPVQAQAQIQPSDRLSSVRVNLGMLQNGWKLSPCLPLLRDLSYYHFSDLVAR